ncbi:MAG: small multi-drug export protein [Clostridia bacterium]|nr:small multi-drug export protein [Clostridia bacterium]
MGDFLLKLLSGINNPELTTLLVSAFPLVELKGAIPIGTGLGLSLVRSALLAYAGSSLVVIPVFFLLIPIFNLLKKIKFIKKLVQKIEAVFNKKAQDLAKKSNGAPEDKVRKILMIALFIFVAVPFPVTGVWTGTAIAVFLNMKFKDSFLPIILGNLVAGSIITLITFLFKDYVNLIITALFIIAIIMLIILIIKIIKSKPIEE